MSPQSLAGVRQVAFTCSPCAAQCACGLTVGLQCCKGAASQGTCSTPRSSDNPYLLRILPPHLTATYAADHDSAIAQCLASLLELDAPLTPSTVRAAQLPQRFGGLGLRCASSDRYAAHWASWCDTLPVVQARTPAAAERLLRALRGEGVPALCHRCDPRAAAPLRLRL